MDADAPFDDDGPRAIVVAADPLARSGLAALVADSGAEVLAAAPLDAVATMLETVPVDLLVVDVLGDDELDLLDSADVPCLALVPDAELGRRAVTRGVMGVVARTSGPERLWPAITAVCVELRVHDPSVVPAVDPSAASAGPDREALVASSGVALTDREHEVLALMGQGLSNREIGEALEISANTAKFHVKAVLDKLGAQTRTEAVVLALRAGLLEL